MDHITTIRNACIAANPSILDLTFGCEVKNPIGSNHRRFFAGQNEEEGEIYYAEIDQVGCEDKQWYSEGILPVKQIIGRPIRLADVLLAIKSKVPAFDGMGDQYAILDCVKIWNLTIDDLTLQSPETLEFISNLLSA